MAKDQMQEVYPVLVNYVDGEQPTANKLNGVLKQTKSSFDAITKAVGDPWDAQVHSFDLSPQKLSVPSLARMIGPSDYLDFAGNANELSTITATLEAERNSWSLGFPLVTISTLSPSSSISAVSAIEWTAQYVSVSGADSALFTDIVDTREEVTENGKFYVDFYRGEIVTYDSIANPVTVTFTGIQMIGPGAPWSSHNVIPTWDEETNLCSVDFESTVGAISTYTLTLPTIAKAPRASNSPSAGGIVSYSIDSADQTHVTFDKLYGEGSKYRLPMSIVNWTTGEEVPEGFFLLWDDTVGRVVPNVTFETLDEYRLTLSTPAGWLAPITHGVPVTDRYRLICTGASLAESLGWLLASYRDNRHVGLADGASIKNNLSFTNPISHKDLADRFNGALDPAYTRSSALLFRESDLPTNEHPQYLHRYGYADADLTGNTANAMRGWLSFSNSSYELGNYACNHNTYGLVFGGGKTDGASNDNNSMLGFFGGYDAGLRYPFGVPETGAQPIGGNPESGKHHLHGALTYIPWYGAPLYLRGRNDTATPYSGAMIGFDLERQTEVNYIKLLPAYRDGTEDYPHMPALVDQSVSGALIITPALDILSGQKRIAAEQVREWRFRGVPKVSSATNPSDSVGQAAIDDGDTNGSQFNAHFTSPGAIGADFVNVYSNAIFFSDTGDGKLNSFTVHGKDWIDDGNIEDFPTGMYYVPAQNASSGTSATAIDNSGYTYLVIDGNVTADWKSGEYVQFEYTNIDIVKQIIQVDKVIYETPIAGKTGLRLVDTFAHPLSQVGTVYKKLYGYFSLFNQHSDLPNGSSAISLSCGVNHGFGYSGNKFIALSGYKVDGANMLLPNFTSTWLNLIYGDHNTLIADSKVGKHVGLFSYDGQVNIGTFNSSNPGTARHLNIFTSATNPLAASVNVGNINIEAGNGVAIPSSFNCNVNITAFNNVKTRASLGYVSLIASVDAIPGLVGPGDVYVKADNDIILSSDATASISSTADISIFSDANVIISGTATLSASGNGNVSLFSSDTGNVSIYSTVGNVTINAQGTGTDLVMSSTTTGNVDINTSDGDIEIWAVSGDLNLYTTNGNVNIEPGGTGHVYSNTILTEVGSGGNVVVTATGVLANAAASSETYKTNINKIDDISWIYSLSLKEFKYKADIERGEDSILYGFIAEEVDTVNKDLVYYKEGKPNALKYNSIFSSLVKAIQDQKNEIEELKSAIQSLRSN